MEEKGRTASKVPEIPGWYIEFQANVLRQLPRPGEIDRVTAEACNRSQAVLKAALATTFEGLTNLLENRSPIGRYFMTVKLG
jgi:hypothetical protein